MMRLAATTGDSDEAKRVAKRGNLFPPARVPARIAGASTRLSRNLSFPPQLLVRRRPFSSFSSQAMWNVLRHHAKHALRPIAQPAHPGRTSAVWTSSSRARLYATTTSTTSTYVPPASVRDMDEEADHEDYEESDGKLPHPESSNFYSGRSAYFDQTNVLEDALKHTRKALTTLSLLPLPAFARAALPPFQPVWKPQAQMGQAIGMRLKTSRYRKLTALLNQLDEHKRIAQAAGYNELAERIILVLALFERENKEAVLMRGRRKPVKFDDYGRSYTLGKRKESSARVWMIAVKERPQEVGSASVDKATEELLALKQANPDLAASNVPIERPEDSVRAGDLPTTNILINNVPLIQYLYVSPSHSPPIVCRLYFF